MTSEITQAHLEPAFSIGTGRAEANGIELNQQVLTKIQSTADATIQAGETFINSKTASQEITFTADQDPQSHNLVISIDSNGLRKITVEHDGQSSFTPFDRSRFQSAVASGLEQLFTELGRKLTDQGQLHDIYANQSC